LFHIKEESVNLGIICEFLICFGIILGFTYFGLNSEIFHSLLPNLNSIGVWLFSLSLVIAALVAYGTWNHKDQQCKKFPISTPTQKRRLVLLFLTGAICLALVPVFSSWSTGNYHLNVIGGLLPVYDAGAYYNGAEKILQNGQLDSWNQRRPLTALFLATKLLLTNLNYRLAVLFQAGIFGFSAFMAAYAILRTHGKAAAFVFFSGILSMTVLFLPEVLSEILGVTLGCLSFSLVWFGIFEKKSIPFFLGLFFLSIALLVRAGPMLILPFLVLYAGYLFRAEGNYSWREVIIAAGSIVSGFLINQCLIWLYGDGKGMMLSNFAVSLYGLAAGGKGWTQYQTDFPMLQGTEAQMSSFLYEQSYRLIAQNPAGFVMTIFSELVTQPVIALQQNYQSLFSGMYTNPVPEGQLSVFFYFGFYTIILIGFLHFVVSNKKHPVNYYFLGSLIAIFLSLPFFYADSGFRALSALFPVIAAIIAMGTFGWRLHPSESDPQSRSDSLDVVRISFVAGTAIIVLACITPLIGPAVTGMLLQNTPLTPFSQSISSQGSPFVIRVDLGMPYIKIMNQSKHSPTFSPEIYSTDFIVPEWLKKDYDFNGFPDDPSRPILLRGYDYNTRETVLILAPEGFIPKSREIVTFNATRTRNETPVPYAIYRVL